LGRKEIAQSRTGRNYLHRAEQVGFSGRDSLFYQEVKDSNLGLDTVIPD
jgi:hypothetical protein